MSHVKATVIKPENLTADEAELLRLLCEGKPLSTVKELMGLGNRKFVDTYDSACFKLDSLHSDDPLSLAKMVAIAKGMIAVEMINTTARPAVYPFIVDCHE